MYSFAKNSSEEVRVSAGEFKEKIYIDLRIFYRDQETDEMRPTKKGLTLALALLPELKKGLQKIDPHTLAQTGS